jgi:hypothetical protein
MRSEPRRVLILQESARSFAASPAKGAKFFDRPASRVVNSEGTGENSTPE